MYSSEIKQLENSEVEISAEIPAEEFETYRSEAVRRLGEHMDVPGFRKGNVPENVLVQKVGEEAVLYEMAEQAISRAYPKLLEEHSIKAIGRPRIALTKIAKQNPLGFTATTATLPEISLPDYAAIARDAVSETSGEPVDVSEEDVTRVIDDIRTQWSRGGTPGENGTGGDDEQKQEQLPEINDEFVKKLGAFESVQDFREKIKENLREEKQRKNTEKRRMKIVESIADKLSADIPAVLVDAELDKMLAQLKDNISRTGIKPEDYFKQIKKTEDDMRSEWRAEAEKRVKIQLALERIAEKEGITAPEEEVQKNIEMVRQQHPDADPERIRGYIESMITNEKVFEFLEKS